MTAPFPDLVLAALDAADVAPDSEAGRIALDRAPDAMRVVRPTHRDVEHYQRCYRWRPAAPPCPQLAAVNLVLHAMSEASRGVRVVSTSRAKP